MLGKCTDERVNGKLDNLVPLGYDHWEMMKIMGLVVARKPASHGRPGVDHIQREFLLCRNIKAFTASLWNVSAAYLPISVHLSCYTL